MKLPLSARVVLGVAVGVTLGAIFRTDTWLGALTNADLGALGMLVIRMLKALATPLILFAILDSVFKTSLSRASGLRLAAVCVVNVLVAMGIGLLLLDLVAPGERWVGQLEALGAQIGA